MIIDAFTYNGEDDLLRIRLALLYDHIDRFVIVEADKTFTGKYKTKKFDADLFSQYKAKISYYFIDTLSQKPQSAWQNERIQRNSIFDAISENNDNTLFILSDIDEIPNPSAIKSYNPAEYLSASLVQNLYYFKLNYQVVNLDGTPFLWGKPKISTVGNFRRFYKEMESLRIEKFPGWFRSVKRLIHKKNHQLIQDGGWHFSYLMPPNKIIEKINSFSHTELNVPSLNDEEFIKKAIENRLNIFTPNTKIVRTDLQHSFPENIANLESFAKWYCDGV